MTDIERPAARLSRASYSAGPRSQEDLLDHLERLATAIRDLKPTRLDEVPNVFTEVSLDGDSLDSLAITPPEALDGPLEAPASWVYVLGAIGYQMATGKRLFPQDDEASIRQRIELVEPTSPSFIVPEIAEDVEAFLYNCLEKLADDRYESVDFVLTALGRLRAGRPITRLRESGFSMGDDVFVMNNASEEATEKSAEGHMPPTLPTGRTHSSPGFLTVIAITFLAIAWMLLF